LQEQGVANYDYSSWIALFFHKGVPSDVVEILKREAQSISEDRDFQVQLIRSGLEPWPKTAKQLEHIVESDFQRWKKIIQDANIQG
jgi:tripartite-type tricarboxylate transporter receptor subunit TctC